MTKLKELNNKLLDEKNNDILTDNVQQSLMKRKIDDLHIELKNLMKRIDDLNIESNQKSTEINNLRRTAIELKNLARPQFSTL